MMGGPVFTVFKFYDVAKYMYDPNHLIVTTMTVVNKAWFDKLAPDLQKVVADAGVKATKDVYQFTIDYLAKQRDGWTAAGGEITQPTAAEHAQLMKLMLPIGDEVTSRKPEEKALFELLQRAAKRTE
jgi:TRAP-type C4-dicarboxylate transport system substrate-binding protein